jgi:hypothetical protein
MQALIMAGEQQKSSDDTGIKEGRRTWIDITRQKSRARCPGMA